MFLFNLHQETMLIGLVQGMPNLKLEYIYVLEERGKGRKGRGFKEIRQVLVICKCSLWNTGGERKSRCVFHSTVKVCEKVMEVLFAPSPFYLLY